MQRLCSLHESNGPHVLSAACRRPPPPLPPPPLRRPEFETLMRSDVQKLAASC
eukprot:CAMPEP_0202833132 /NCGR_PEP_ID=MMETSP1389-20130828/23379_1 /ASSEMBLY_ACC=CAM_ASM_000865 /TAXON_ID=302021 /ORGANISM="Rhodomonas sp., Strain CCMP768" /LENGTH=52 /DNA_ID=CAMNT_0049507577 /DNA_START=48 /DNA_END=203 /DNA_ORIENTATION=-